MERFDIFHQILFWVGLAFPLGPTPSRGGTLGAWLQGKKSVPLDTSISDIGGDEIPLGSNVDLVPRLVIIWRAEDSFTCKHRVPAVGTSLLHLFIFVGPLDFFVVHLCSDTGPDTVASHQDIRIGRPLLQIHSDTLALPVRSVSLYRISILDKIRFDLAALINQNFLQIRSINDTRIRQSIEIGTFLEGKFHKPIGGCILVEEVINAIIRHTKRSIGTKSILDTTGTCSRKGEFLHDASKQRLVNLLKDTEGIGGELDGSPKASEGGCFFIDCDIESFLEHVECCGESSDSSTGDGHLEGTAGSGGEG
mmetsp:Transcript_19078/g.28967  ORF Transcript_19078/g.28967 Transcript_19078/m.28967 type:complete len:308 (-) Transcript_19078:321-1244(-)